MRLVSIALCLFTFFLIAGCSQDVSLTKEEKVYIDSHVVNLGVDINYRPFDYMDGIPKGMAIDLLDIISKKTGLKIRLEQTGQFEDILGNLRTGNVDLLTALRPTPSRAKFAIFSRPFTIVDIVMLKRVNMPVTVGAGRGYAIVNFIEVERKDLFIHEYDDDDISIQALMAGQVDSIVLDAVVAKQLMRKYNVEFDETRIPFEYPLSFAVKKDNVILRSIIDKALSSISTEEQLRIKEKWM